MLKDLVFARDSPGSAEQIAMSLVIFEGKTCLYVFI
jgi:hypothetical protein